MQKGLTMETMLRFVKGLMFAVCVMFTIVLMVIALIGSGPFDTYENIVVNAAPAYYLYIIVKVIDRLYATFNH